MPRLRPADPTGHAARGGLAGRRSRRRTPTALAHRVLAGPGPAHGAGAALPQRPPPRLTTRTPGAGLIHGWRNRPGRAQRQPRPAAPTDQPAGERSAPGRPSPVERQQQRAWLAADLRVHAPARPRPHRELTIHKRPGVHGATADLQRVRRSRRGTAGLVGCCATPTPAIRIAAARKKIRPAAGTPRREGHGEGAGGEQAEEQDRRGAAGDGTPGGVQFHSGQHRVRAGSSIPQGPIDPPALSGGEPSRERGGEPALGTPDLACEQPHEDHEHDQRGRHGDQRDGRGAVRVLLLVMRFGP